MSSPKWSGKSKKFNPSRTFVMSDASPIRKFNPKSTFMPGSGLASPNSSSHALNASSGAAGPGGMAGVAGNVPLSALGEQVEHLSLYHPPLHPLQYQLYAPTPFRAHLAAHERRAEDFATPEDLRRDLIDRNTETLQILMGPSALPEQVHNYHSLIPLDKTSGETAGVEDYSAFSRTSASTAPDGSASHSSAFKSNENPRVFRYKAISHANARTYCLLRIDGLDSVGEHDNPLQIVNKWRRVQHSAIAGVVESFTTLAFGTPKPSLVVVYEYFPRSITLKEKEWTSYGSQSHLWSIAVQLVGALQAIHRRGLACRGALSEKFVLLQQSSAPAYPRVRIGSLGVIDILHGPLNLEDLASSEQQDYHDLRLLLERISAKPKSGANQASPSPLAPLPVNTPPLSALNSAGSAVNSGTELVDLLNALDLGDPTKINELLAPHVFKAADHANRRIDDLENVLAQELENGRLFRLLAKLEFVLEGTDPKDNLAKSYALHLFKKFVFGQRTEKGHPTINLGHALAALNRLDAGTEENVLLVSEDAKTRIIVSYKELKQAFVKEFDAKINPVS